MSQNIWDLADEIVNSVTDAIKTENYSGLGQKIQNTVDDITASAKDMIKESQNTQTAYFDPQQGRYVSKGSYINYNPNYQKKFVSINQQEKNKVKERREEDTELIVCKDNYLPGRVSSHFEIGFGIAGAAIFAYPIFERTFTFISSIIEGELTAGIAFTWLLVTTIFGLSINAIRKGRARLNKNKRFKIYKQVIGSKGYCSILDLAKEIGKNKGFIKRDLKKMMDEKYFLQGHFDKEETTFITSDKVYDNYLHTEEMQQQYISQKESEDSHETDTEEKSIVEEGRAYIEKIRRANDRIQGEVITEKLNTMEDIIKRIFDRVEKEPSSSDDLRRMMKYYLPTTVKLLNAYIELDGQPSYGDNNVAKSKQEIEATLDVINEAFGNIFDSMYEDTAWDISSDISTMKTMMKQDGLTGVNEFK